jgi:hypothetical protein
LAYKCPAPISTIEYELASADRDELAVSKIEAKWKQKGNYLI